MPTTRAVAQDRSARAKSFEPRLIVSEVPQIPLHVQYSPEDDNDRTRKMATWTDLVWVKWNSLKSILWGLWVIWCPLDITRIIVQYWMASGGPLLLCTVLQVRRRREMVPTLSATIESYRQRLLSGCLSPTITTTPVEQLPRNTILKWFTESLHRDRKWINFRWLRWLVLSCDLTATREYMCRNVVNGNDLIGMRVKLCIITVLGEGKRSCR